MPMLSPSGKRNKIANYMDSLPEEFDVVEDMMGEKNPTIKLATKSRIITLTCDDKGKVIEEFTMKDSNGDKNEFLKKQKAYDAIIHYYNDYYTGAKVTKSSFEEGTLTIELENRIVTLSYDESTNSIEEKDKAKKSRKQKPFEQMNIFDLPKEKKAPTKSSNDDIENKQQELIKSQSISVQTTKSKYNKWNDGLKVRNIFNQKVYKVKRDDGNLIEVFDHEYGYLIMARADLEIVD